MLPLFISDTLIDGKIATIADLEARHASDAVRVKTGDIIEVTNGRGAVARLRVIEISKREVRGEILDYREVAPPEIQLTVVQALTKSDRARENIELLTQAGADRLIPWAATHCVSKWQSPDSGVEKWQSWAREATKQSRRYFIPEISPLHRTDQLLKEFPKFDLILLGHEEGGVSISDVKRDRFAQMSTGGLRSVALVIGPEGGITDREVETLIEGGAMRVTFGSTIFRSAHAGIAALAALQTSLEIW
jgi:16S rRNA (uracil1498-N3)-methyltransferase